MSKDFSKRIAELTPEEYHVTQEKGTERPYTGKYDKFFKDGKYECTVCGTVLFESETKFNSGCGWPAFYAAAGAKGTDTTDANVVESADDSHGMQRVEVTCKTCGAHLGHVFEDGPRDKTGLRYCINSVSLNFQPKNK